jgi:hypothetical protein
MQIKFLISPVQPSGLTWLVNCLIELGLYTTKSDQEIWEKQENGKYKVKRDFQDLARWLPALSDPNREFTFSTNLKILWSHDWPIANLYQEPILFFTRDPRTSLYSEYRRLGKVEFSFEQFLREPDMQRLVNRMNIWNLFHALWSCQELIMFVNFESYKTNPKMVLEECLNFLNIRNTTDAERENALAKSTFEIARAAEKEYLETHDKDLPAMIRSSSIIPENISDQAAAYTLIENMCTETYRYITGKSAVVPSYHFDLLTALRVRYSDSSEISKVFHEKYFGKYRLLANATSISIEDVALFGRDFRENFAKLLVRTTLRNLYSDLKNILGGTGKDSNQLKFFFLSYSLTVFRRMRLLMKK